MVSSVYIHIPFCKKICSYCDFCKVFYNKKMVKEYLSSLRCEILDRYHGEDIETIYIGGGTPSCLDIAELEELFDIVSIFNTGDDLEFSIECNFDSIDKEKLDLFKRRGINRLSFGIETTDKDSLTKINRDLDLDYVKEIINYSKSIGIDNINVDLMYAFSFSNMEKLKKDVDFILDLDVKHISTYSLIIENNTKFYIDNIKNISEEEDLEMYNYIHNRLVDNGYSHYEISNYSRDGYQSKHNLVYWHNEEYYGFGVSASSYVNDKRFTNTRSITKYIKYDSNLVIETEYLSLKDKMIYEMILGLRLDCGVSDKDFYNKYHKHINQVFDTSKLVYCDDYYSISFDKWYIINSILVDFLEVKDNG